TVLIFCFGIAGIFGSVLFAKYSASFPFAALFAPILLLLVCLFGLKFLDFSHISMIFLVFLWGISVICFSLALQVKVLELAPDATDVAMSIYSGIYNIGIGGGAFVGGLIFEHISKNSIGFGGAGFAFVSVLLLIFMYFMFVKPKKVYM
ncbi:MAG: sugar transporter, partial [Campylobacteraceae bacterium]